MIEYTIRPAFDYVTVAEAANSLGVTADRVRRLIATGELPASRFGRDWAIPRDAVERRRSTGSHRAGRRFTPANAWGVLYLAVGLQAPWLDRHERWRIKQHLSKRDLGSLRAQLVERGRAHAFRAHPSMVGDLRSERCLMLTGTTGATEHRLGLIGGSDRVEAYVAATDFDDLVCRYHLRSSREPNVVLRVVPSFGARWPLARVAPVSAVALDLLDDPEPRAQQVGIEALGDIQRGTDPNCASQR